MSEKGIFATLSTSDQKSFPQTSHLWRVCVPQCVALAFLGNAPARKSTFRSRSTVFGSRRSLRPHLETLFLEGGSLCVLNNRGRKANRRERSTTGGEKNNNNSKQTSQWLKQHLRKLVPEASTEAGFSRRVQCTCLFMTVVDSKKLKAQVYAQPCSSSLSVYGWNGTQQSLLFLLNHFYFTV